MWNFLIRKYTFDMVARACFYFILFACLIPGSAALSAFAKAEEPVTITINAVAGLQFDVVRFSVTPGQKVKIVFVNKDDMSHNLLFAKPGMRLQVVNAAIKLEEKGPEKEYIPDSPYVLWAMPVLSPGEEKTLTFTAPGQEGIYPYVCTFPGHGFSMYGAMYVTTVDTMPALQDDSNIPAARRELKVTAGDDKRNHTTHASKPGSPHPYALTPPYLYRAYMEAASTASIAVHLPHELSYCWDAGTCELRYAWEGAFVDNTGLWKGKPNSVAKVLGTIFFRSKASRALRIGNRNEDPHISYRGYRLLDRYPEFHYTLDGVDVFEIIHPKEDGSGLIRTFRMPEAAHDIFFYTHPGDGVQYETSSGHWEKNVLILSPEEGKKFTIIMTKKEGLKL